MGAEITVFDIAKSVLLWLSPVIFLSGIVIVLYGNYEKLEETFGKELGGIKKKLLPAIETNIYTFHEWLMERRTVVGLICIIGAMILFFVLKK